MHMLEDRASGRRAGAKFNSLECGGLAPLWPVVNAVAII
jgi:hypothetical protein